MKTWFSCICVFMSLIGGVPMALCGGDTTEYQIVFSTFENQAAGKYSYLSDSIQGMLISRLAAKDRVQVIDKLLSKDELNVLKKKKDFSSLAIKEGEIDYIVTGRLFGVTSGLNVQVALYPLDASKEVLNFSVLSETQENIIPDIGKLSEQIAQRGFGYPATKTPSKKKGVMGTGEEAFTTVHPEAAYKKGLYSGSVIGSKVGGFEVESIGSKRTLDIDGAIITFAVGDADNDGKEEIFVVKETRLQVYRVRERKIVKIDETKLTWGLRVHALDLADINEDGKLELYLSATDELSVSSAILSWEENKGFTFLAEEIPLYLRPVDVPNKGICLAGQERGDEKIELVKPGIRLYSLDATNSLKPEEPLPIPRSINLFDFSYADLDGDNTYELVVVDQEDNLQVYSPSNELMWVSSSKFGGSKTYLGPSQGDSGDGHNLRSFSEDENAERDLIFVPGKMTVVDIDGNGSDEVIIAKSKMSTLGFFERLRPYKSGELIGLVWEENGFSEAWRTGKYKGYLVGHAFHLQDLRSDRSTGKGSIKSKATLYIANIPTSGSLVAMLPGAANTDLSLLELTFSVTKTN